MLKVGVPEAFDPQLYSLLPDGIDLQIIPMNPERTYSVEFWIAPPVTKQAQHVWSHLEGVRVVQATVAGIEEMLKFLPKGIQFCDARGVHNISTAEWTVSAILASLKYFPFYDDLRRTAAWSRRNEADEHYRTMYGISRPIYPPVLLEELHGKRVLIVGYGAIGGAIEERLIPFGVEVDRIARTARKGVFAADKLPELLPSADVIVLIVPSTAETARLIGAKEFAAMKPGALLVNAARGPVVDTDALLAALHSGRIRAALDVTDPEPLPDGHPLWSAPNLLLTPHVAGSTPMFTKRAMEFASTQVTRYLRGEPLENVVTGDY